MPSLASLLALYPFTHFCPLLQAVLALLGRVADSAEMNRGKSGARTAAEARVGMAEGAARGPRRREVLREGAGLTLIEVIVSLAILGMGLAVIMQGLSLGVRVRGDSAIRARLHLAAGNVLAGLIEKGSVASGVEEGEEESYRWRIESVAAPAAEEDTPLTALAEVRITVESKEGREVSLVTLMAVEEDDGP